MSTETTPEHWYWSHDIQPHQLDSLATPHFRLVRLAHYGARFAALFHQTPGPPRTHALDLTARDLATLPGRPVAVTVDTTRAEPLFSVVLDGATAGTTVHVDLDGAAAGTTLHVDLDEAGLHGVAGRILDVDTYVTGGTRRYAAVVDASVAPGLVYTDVSRRELNRALRKHRAVPTAVRPAGAGTYTMTADPHTTDRADWHANLDADAVASRLHRDDAYPADLDAVRTGRGVRFTVIVRTARSRTRP